MESLDSFLNKYRTNCACKCAIDECNKKAEFDIGDIRCSFPVCLEHSGLVQYWIQTYEKKYNVLQKIKARLEQIENNKIEGGIEWQPNENEKFKKKQ